MNIYMVQVEINPGYWKLYCVQALDEKEAAKMALKSNSTAKHPVVTKVTKMDLNSSWRAQPAVLIFQDCGGAHGGQEWYV